VVWRRQSRNLCGSRGGGDLRGVEPRRDSRGGPDISVAVFPAVVAVCAGCRSGTFQNGHLRRSPPSTRDDRARLSRRRAGGDVELHGLGQRVDHRAGSGAAAANLSPGDDRCGHSCCAELCAAFCSRVSDRRPVFPFRGRWLVGQRGGSTWRNRRRIRLAAIPGRARRNDEWVRNVQCAGDELLAFALGNGSGWHAPESVRQNKQTDERAVARGRSLRSVLGIVPRAGIQAAHHAGHHAQVLCWSS